MANPRGANELGRSEEQKGALWLLEPTCEAGREGAAGLFPGSLSGHGEASDSPQKVMAGALSSGGLQADVCKRSLWKSGKRGGWSKRKGMRKEAV